MGLAQVDVQSFIPNPIGAQTILFFIVAGIAALAAIGVVAFKKPVRSAICLVTNFISLAVLYFMLNAEMLAITQVVVYTGAIMVLFIFVIMLLNLGAPNALKESRDLKRIFAGLFAVALFGVVFWQVILPLVNNNLPNADDAFGTPEHIGRSLLTSYVWPFEMVSVLLLVGIVGSILLVKRRSR
jgi:NADH-quinone oxidoreductase subunit J